MNHAAARLEGAPHVAKAGHRIGKEHGAEACKDEIELVRREVWIFREEKLENELDGQEMMADLGQRRP